MPPTFPINIGWNEKEMRIFTDRSDLQPVYQGFAGLQGDGVDPDTAANIWTIYKYAYAAGGNITRRQIRFKKAWDNVASIF